MKRIRCPKCGCEGVTPGPWTKHEKGIHPHPYICGPAVETEYGEDRFVIAYVTGASSATNQSHLARLDPATVKAMAELAMSALASRQPQPVNEPGEWQEIGEGWQVHTLEEKQEVQRNAGIPHLPTDLTLEARLAVSGRGPRAFQWSDKKHRLVYDLCREIERIAAYLRAASIPKVEPSRHPVIWMEFNNKEGFTGLRRWTRDPEQAARWKSDPDAGRFEEYYAAPQPTPVTPVPVTITPEVADLQAALIAWVNVAEMLAGEPGMDAHFHDVADATFDVVTQARAALSAKPTGEE